MKSDLHAMSLVMETALTDYGWLVRDCLIDPVARRALANQLAVACAIAQHPNAPDDLPQMLKDAISWGKTANAVLNGKAPKGKRMDMIVALEEIRQCLAKPYST